MHQFPLGLEQCLQVLAAEDLGVLPLDGEIEQGAFGLEALDLAYQRFLHGEGHVRIALERREQMKQLSRGQKLDAGLDLVVVVPLGHVGGTQVALLTQAVVKSEQIVVFAGLRGVLFLLDGLILLVLLI